MKITLTLNLIFNILSAIFWLALFSVAHYRVAIYYFIGLIVVICYNIYLLCTEMDATKAMFGLIPIGLYLLCIIILTLIGAMLQTINYRQFFMRLCPSIVNFIVYLIYYIVDKKRWSNISTNV